MYAIEFKTKIKNGNIEIPKRFRTRLQNEVKVIILVENVAANTQSDIIEELLKSPLKIDEFKPYKREDLYARAI